MSPPGQETLPGQKWNVVTRFWCGLCCVGLDSLREIIEHMLEHLNVQN